EWEHVFLQLRFGKHYRWLRTHDLDDQRLQFYALAMHLSLVTGPLHLLDGDFPEREAMMGIVESNIQRVLTFLR
nr:aminoglycoside phosphotransferase family protein [Chloroflexota bacterium]